MIVWIKAKIGLIQTQIQYTPAIQPTGNLWYTAWSVDMKLTSYCALLEFMELALDEAEH